MISDEYPDEYVTAAAPYGEPVDSFEEEDEEEGSGSAAGFGSLLSLGSTMRKKQPLIVVDPIEAENEARRVQFVAAQRFVAADETEAMAFLKGMTCLAKSVAAQEDAPVGEQAIVVDDAAGDETAIESTTERAEQNEPGVLPLSESMAEVMAGRETVIQASETLPETITCEAPVVVQDGELACAAIEAQPPAAEPLSARPVPVPLRPVPQGHSLRARIPTQLPRRTFADHLLAFLGWLHDRVMLGRT